MRDEPNPAAVQSEIRDALDFSRNFANAKPDIGQTEKMHILGLCTLLEKVASLQSAQSPAVSDGDEIERVAIALHQEHFDRGRDWQGLSGEVETVKGHFRGLAHRVMDAIGTAAPVSDGVRELDLSKIEPDPELFAEGFAWREGAPRQAKGVLNSAAKLDEEQVRAIFNSRGITQHELARLYGVSAGTIANIKAGFNWNHVTGLPLRPKKVKRSRNDG